MYFKSLLMGVGLALCCGAACPVYGGNDSPNAGRSSASGVLTLSGKKLAQKLAKISPGASTKSQVLSLLGTPWRTVQYNDMERLEDEIWEYRGLDANGSYRIHIEFGPHDVVRVIGKIPDSPSAGKGTAAQTAPAKAAQTPDEPERR
jgi:hypothetical protein